MTNKKKLSERIKENKLVQYLDDNPKAIVELTVAGISLVVASMKLYVFVKGYSDHITVVDQDTGKSYDVLCHENKTVTL